MVRAVEETDHDELPEAADKIAGGSVSDGLYPQVIAIKKRTASGENKACSGTVVGRNAVLTAAHCTCGDVVAYEFYVGRRWSKPLMHEGQPIGVRKVVLGDEAFCGREKNRRRDDVALLFTEHRVDDALGEGRFALGETTELTSFARPGGFGNDTIVFVGYGPSEHTGFGTKHHIDGYEYQADLTNSKLGSATRFELPGVGCDTGIRKGDSGGAVFQRGQLVGVLTQSWEVCPPAASAFVFGSDPTSKKIRQALRDEAETHCNTLDEL